MDGQMTIFDYLTDILKELELKYPIPRLDKKWRDEEGWCDDWHYCQIEQPEVDDIYCGIVYYTKEEYYNYTYLLWIGTRQKWYIFDSWWKKWIEPRQGTFPLAWVRVPKFFRENDKGYKLRCESLEQFCHT